MNYNLTDKQKELARWIAASARSGKIGETFAGTGYGSRLVFRNGDKDLDDAPGDFAMLQCLGDEELLLVSGNFRYFTGVVKAKLYRAVDANFVEQETSPPISILAHPHPPEISMSLDRLRARYPDPKKVGFLIMRFSAAKPFAEIVRVIKETADKHGIAIIRADEHEFHSDLFGNVRTFLHGCGFGIAIYERIQTDKPNANVGLEVGYLMAMNKPVLLLKDKTVETLQADLAGKLYKPFDPHDPQGTIPEQLTKWLKDYGIIVS